MVGRYGLSRERREQDLEPAPGLLDRQSPALACPNTPGRGRRGVFHALPAGNAPPGEGNAGSLPTRGSTPLARRPWPHCKRLLMRLTAPTLLKTAPDMR